MSPEIASTWLKLTGKKRSREFSHSLDPSGTLSLLQRRHPESPKRTLSCMRRRATRATEVSAYTGSLFELSLFLQVQVICA